MASRPLPPLPHATQARVLVVDDSVVARAVIARMIDASRRFTMAGSVGNADAALAFLRESSVDIIILDLEMPGVNGLTALPDLLVAGKGARILIVSSSAGDGAAATVQALALGAADTLVKPGIGNYAGRFAEVLEEKMARLVFAPEQHSASVRQAPVNATDGFDILAIGASTGGIHALSQLLRVLPPTMDQPILVTQHLPHSFMPYFAAQLALISGRPCDVAQDHARVISGRILIAPGDAHIRVVSLGRGQAAVRLTHEATISGCTPSVDPMLESIAEVFGARGLAVILSGMGRDGCDGARKLAAVGGRIGVQDRATSVVWGMPGAIAEAGIASAMLAPEELGGWIAGQRRRAL